MIRRVLPPVIALLWAASCSSSSHPAASATPADKTACAIVKAIPASGPVTQPQGQRALQFGLQATDRSLRSAATQLQTSARTGDNAGIVRAVAGMRSSCARLGLG